MKRYIVTHTSDYYSGGSSIGWGFQGDFDSISDAVESLRGKMGACSAADILDTKLRKVATLVEQKPSFSQEHFLKWIKLKE